MQAIVGPRHAGKLSGSTHIRSGLRSTHCRASAGRRCWCCGTPGPLPGPPQSHLRPRGLAPRQIRGPMSQGAGLSQKVTLGWRPYGRNAEYGVHVGAGLRSLGSRIMTGLGEWWNCPAGGGRRVRGGAGRAAVLVLLPVVRGAAAAPGGAVPGWLKRPRWAGRFLGRALAGVGARCQSPLCWPPAGPGPVGRPAVGG
jgi:hypothetical protein